METVGVYVVALFTMLFGLTIYRYYVVSRRLRHWRKLGVKGPQPSLLFGNLRQLLNSNRYTKDIELTQKYGKIYGTYTGTTSTLVVADPEVLRQICIKDFDVFPNHYSSGNLNPYQLSFLIFSRDEHWRTMRVIMTPIFTSGKIRRMFKLLDACADDLVESFDCQLKDSPGSSITLNMKDAYGMYTLDAISTCCYGLKLKRANTMDIKTALTRDEFVRICMLIFKQTNYRLLLARMLPEWLRFYASPLSQFKPLYDRIQQIIEARKRGDVKYDDYLQLLVDAKMSDEVELSDTDLMENHHASLTNESIMNDQSDMINKLEIRDLKKRVKLSDLDIAANGMFLMAVGLETTGTLLAHATFALSYHQDIQQRLYEEILCLGEYDSTKSRFYFSYDALLSCQYLDAVISESLRIMPPIVQMDRTANRDYTIEKYNINIKNGQAVNLNFCSIMNDHDYWENPRLFDPERFMPENRNKIVPGSYCPFGIGPRHCLGMRFSLIETKLALAKILVNYKLKQAPNTKFPPECGSSFILARSFNINVTIERRE